MELPKNVKDISGLRVGRLVVKEFSHLQNHKAIWLCDCDCGNDIVNIGLHFFHKDVRLYAASCSEV